jgi:plasmid stabilization system protein ParE
MARRRIIWSQKAKTDVDSIRAFIARRAPKTAKSYARRLIAYVNKLRDFPERGAIVESLGEPYVREIYFDSFRIIYDIIGKDIRVLTVRRGVRLLGPQDLQ